MLVLSTPRMALLLWTKWGAASSGTYWGSGALRHDGILTGRCSRGWIWRAPPQIRPVLFEAYAQGEQTFGERGYLESNIPAFSQLSFLRGWSFEKMSLANLNFLRFEVGPHNWTFSWPTFQLSSGQNQAQLFSRHARAYSEKRGKILCARLLCKWTNSLKCVGHSC